MKPPIWHPQQPFELPSSQFRIPAIRVKGFENHPVEARILADSARAQISHFIHKNRQAYNLGTTNFQGGRMNLPGVTMRYIHSFGQEIVYLEFSPEVIKEVLERPEEIPTVPDFIVITLESEPNPIVGTTITEEPFAYYRWTARTRFREPYDSDVILPHGNGCGDPVGTEVTDSGTQIYGLSEDSPRYGFACAKLQNYIGSGAPYYAYKQQFWYNLNNIQIDHGGGINTIWLQVHHLVGLVPSPNVNGAATVTCTMQMVRVFRIDDPDPWVTAVDIQDSVGNYDHGAESGGELPLAAVVLNTVTFDASLVPNESLPTYKRWEISNPSFTPLLTVEEVSSGNVFQPGYAEFTA
jgi:hypothetical protein